jgi:hypothetical protein
VRGARMRGGVRGRASIMLGGGAAVRGAVADAMVVDK